jgi:hypothetical protein
MPAFPYKRAALVLAEAELFGDGVACKKWSVPHSTLKFWRSRLSSDEKLEQLYLAERTNLLENWQGDTIRVMKAVLGKLEKNIQAMTEDGDPKVVMALNAVAKTIGELAIANTVLQEEDESDSNQ